MASPVFEKMFTSDFKESRTKEVVMKNKESKIVVCMINMMYPQLNFNFSKTFVMYVFT